jgi:hypothetical protein
MLDARCADAFVGLHRLLFTRELEEDVFGALDYVRIRAESSQLPRSRGFWQACLPRFERLCWEVARMGLRTAANDPAAASPSLPVSGSPAVARAIGRDAARSLRAIEDQDAWELRRALQAHPPCVAEGILLSIEEVRAAFVEEASSAPELTPAIRARYLRLLARLERAFRQLTFDFALAS